MKKILILFVLFCYCVICPCYAAKSETGPQKTQLEKRQMQTKVFETNDKAMIMRAMLNILQDEGFIINNANPLLGFISAVKEFDSKDKNIDTEKEFGVSKGRLSWTGVAVASVDATSNVSEYGSNIRVRVNFKRKMMNAYGSPVSIEEIDNPEYYRNFFEKVDKAVFLQKQKI